LTGWSLEKVERVVKAGNENPDVEVHIGKGGTVQHRGSERGTSNGLYDAIIRIIKTYWGPRDLGLRNISVADTSRAGTRGQGVWSHPDLVIAADPRRKAYRDEPRRLHAIEVETKSGFDLRSIYQAHAQGRGAGYTWVIGNKHPGVEPGDWERILWTASDLGVGLVTYQTAGAYTTWKHHLDAVYNAPTADQRDAFIDLAIGDARRRDLSL
jgi:hypothetical protein